jgi:hypothetical protein
VGAARIRAGLISNAWAVIAHRRVVAACALMPPGSVMVIEEVGQHPAPGADLLKIDRWPGTSTE